MGFIFTKGDKELKNNKAIIDQILADKPMSEDLPENIEEIDQVVGEAYAGGEIDFFSASEVFNKKLEDILRSKGIMPVWDIEDLAYKIFERFVLRKHAWDFGLEKKQAERCARYDKLKDRACVKRIIELTGTDYIPYVAEDAIERIQWIDAMIAAGNDYSEMTSEFALDDPNSLLAFLNHIEETHKTTITTVKQFRKFTHNDENDETTSIALYAAFEARYRLALDRILRDGGKYAQLIALDPKDFHLPRVWYGISQNMTKEKVIRRAITDYFKLDEESKTYGRTAIRNIANLIEAPYVEVLRASHYYSDFYDEPKVEETQT